MSHLFCRYFTFLWVASFFIPLCYPGELAVPCVLENQTFQTTLLLNGSLFEDKSLLLQLYDASGREISTKYIVLKRQESLRISLTELGIQFLEGSARLSFTGPSNEIVGQAILKHRFLPITLNKLARFTDEFSTSRLDALLWMPRGEARTTVYLKNASSRFLTSSLRIQTVGRVSTELVSLPPQSFVGVDMRTLQFGATAITIEHDGTPGEILATANSIFPTWKQGFSTDFFETLPHNRLVSKTFPIGSGSGSAGFLILQNLDSSTADLKIQVTLQQEPPISVEEQLVLSGGELRVHDLRSRLAKYLKAPAFCDLSITHLGKNNIAGRVFTYDETADGLSFSSTVIPFGSRTNTSSFPWVLDQLRDSVVTVHNPNDFETSFNLFLFSTTGNYYSVGLKKLRPGQTIIIKLSELWSTNIPDERGKGLPLARRGMLKLYDRSPNHSLVSQLLVYDRESTSLLSFGCPVCPVYPTGCHAVESSLTLLVNASENVTVWEDFDDGTMANVTSISTLKSADETVAVGTDYTGNIRGVGQGSTTVKAGFYDQKCVARTITQTACWCDSEVEWFYNCLVGATTQVPYYVKVTSDVAMYQDCPNVPRRAWQRRIGYQVYDRGGNAVTKFVLDGLEYASVTASLSCSGGLQAGGTFLAFLGAFTDFLWVCDPDANCYFEFVQDWVIQGFNMIIVRDIAYDYNVIQMNKDFIHWNGIP